MTATLFGETGNAADRLRDVWQDASDQERLEFLDGIRRQSLSRPRRKLEPTMTTRRRRRPSRTPKVEVRP